MERLTRRHEDGTPNLAGKLNAFHMMGDMSNEAAVVFFNLMKRLAEYEDAEESGRLVRLPVAIGDSVFTVQEKYFDCQNCRYKDEAKYDEVIARFCCDNACDGVRHCPLYVKQHEVEGYEVVSRDKIYGPGEWGYERLEEFEDGAFDGKWYLTRAEAEAAMERIGGN